jgi:AbrB family looped-hinge helix DNA binding protein
MKLVRTRITSKGQVTVPVEIRRRLDLQPGDDLVFELRDQELHVWGLKRRELTDLRGALPATRPFLGRDAIREEAGRQLGARHLAAAQVPQGADKARTP